MARQIDYYLLNKGNNNIHIREFFKYFLYFQASPPPPISIDDVPSEFDFDWHTPGHLPPAREDYDN